MSTALKISAIIVGLLALLSIIAIAFIAYLYQSEQAHQAATRGAARHDLLEKVAALKVCIEQGTTLSEFRSAKGKLESSYIVNQPFVPDLKSNFTHLSAVMAATDTLWGKGIGKGETLYPNTIEFQAMFIINPAKAALGKFTNSLSFDQKQHDADFNPENWVHHGLRQVDNESSAIVVLLRRAN